MERLKTELETMTEKPDALYFRPPKAQHEHAATQEELK